MKQGHQYLKQLGIAYTVNPVGVTLVTDDVIVKGRGLTELPFRDIVPWEVGGCFDCASNQLTSLAGAPQSVGWSFDCTSNQLTSLAGAPQSVGGDFWCYKNQLTSLAGAPQSVGGNFSCFNNQLTSLAGAPQTVGRAFTCDGDLLLLNLRAVDELVSSHVECEALRAKLAVRESYMPSANQVHLESLD